MLSRQQQGANGAAGGGANRHFHSQVVSMDQAAVRRDRVPGIKHHQVAAHEVDGWDFGQLAVSDDARHGRSSDGTTTMTVCSRLRASCGARGRSEHPFCDLRPSDRALPELPPGRDRPVGRRALYADTRRLHPGLPRRLVQPLPTGTPLTSVLRAIPGTDVPQSLNGDLVSWIPGSA